MCLFLLFIIFLKANSNDICYLTIPHCISCISVNRCEICDVGYVKNKIQQCVQCNLNCMHCESPSKPDICTECYKGYFLDDSTSTCIKCGNKFCSKCANNTTECSECLPGSYLDENQNCQLCDSTCLTCTGPSRFECSSCKDGYSLINQSYSNYCERCPSNCINCTSDLICKTCKEGFYAY